jgi:hypothetical protein
MFPTDTVFFIWNTQYRINLSQTSANFLQINLHKMLSDFSSNNCLHYLNYFFTMRQIPFLPQLLCMNYEYLNLSWPHSSFSFNTKWIFASFLICNKKKLAVFKWIPFMNMSPLKLYSALFTLTYTSLIC